MYIIWKNCENHGTISLYDVYDVPVTGKGEDHMKRRTLHAAAGMLAAVLMLSLQGCSPMTPARTAERVAETMARTPCTAANLSGQIDISMGVAGLEVDTTVSLEESLIYSPDPQQAYMELEMGY